MNTGDREYRDASVVADVSTEMTARVELALTDKGNDVFGKGFNHDLAMAAIKEPDDENVIINWDAPTAYFMGFRPINMAEKIKVGSDEWMDAQDQKAEMKHD